jgi:hypothetical protein
MYLNNQRSSPSYGSDVCKICKSHDIMGLKKNGSRQTHFWDHYKDAFLVLTALCVCFVQVHVRANTAWNYGETRPLNINTYCHVTCNLAGGLQCFGFVHCLHLQGRYQSVELHSIMYQNSVISILDSVITSKPYHTYDFLKIAEIHANSMYEY